MFKNVVLEVPFLDMINTMADPNIPFTIEEWR